MTISIRFKSVEKSVGGIIILMKQDRFLTELQWSMM